MTLDPTAALVAGAKPQPAAGRLAALEQRLERLERRSVNPMHGHEYAVLGAGSLAGNTGLSVIDIPGSYGPEAILDGLPIGAYVLIAFETNMQGANVASTGSVWLNTSGLSEPQISVISAKTTAGLDRFYGAPGTTGVTDAGGVFVARVLDPHVVVTAKYGAGGGAGTSMEWSNRRLWVAPFYPG